MAAAAAIWVAVKAEAARPLAARALPALKPNQPNQRMAAPGNGHGQVVGMKGFMAVPFAFADDQGRSQGGNPGIDMNHGPPGKIQGAQVSEPAADPPDPVGHRVIDQGAPEQGEDHKSGKFHPFGKGPGDQGRGDNGKHHLKDHKGLMGDGGGIILKRGGPDPAKSEPIQAADDARPESGPKALL